MRVLRWRAEEVSEFLATRGGPNQKFISGVFLNPPQGVAGIFKTPETKNRQRFDFSNFFKLEPMKPGGSNRKFIGGVFLNPPEGVA